MSEDSHRRADEHYERGNALDEKGQIARAITEWQQAIELDPDHAGAHYNLGIAYADEGDNELAIKELGQAIHIDPTDIDARRELAEIYLEEERLSDAVEQIQELLKIAPDDHETIRLLAEVYLVQGKLAIAVRTLEAKPVSEKDADLWFELGQAYEHGKQNAEALTAYHRALEAQPQHRDAILGIERLTRTEIHLNDEAHREADQHFDRGNRFEADGHREQAVKEWQEAIRLDSEHAGAHYNLGIANDEEGNTELAINSLREAARLDPFDTEARKALADIYAEREEWDEAENQLRQALNIAPGDSEAAHMLADLYLAREKWDEASGALEAGGLLEEDADLWFELGQAYAEQGRREDAILAYRRALTALPGHNDAQQALRALDEPLEDPPASDETLESAEI